MEHHTGESNPWKVRRMAALSMLIPLPGLFLVRQDPFFWDTVQLASKHAHFFYENGLNWAILPQEIDSGHPPVFGYYLAVWWTLFGKSLLVSHLSMWPFLSGLIYLLLHTGHRIAGPKMLYGLPLLVFADPVVLTQAALVSPDIALLCFFILSMEGVRTSRNGWLVIGIAGLCMVSMRGMMCATALFFWTLTLAYNAGRLTPGNLARRILPFIPGALAGLCFLIWHHHQAGWTGFHTDSPWSPAFAPVDGRGFLRNAVVLAWRWLDLGRCFEWLVVGTLIWKWRNGTGSAPPRDYLMLFGFLLLLLSPSALLYQNLSAHRYFLPVFAVMHVLVFHWIWTYRSWVSFRRWALALVGSGLLAGHFWIYPQGISMDWDVTLAHRSFHPLRAEMCSFLDENRIPWDNVGSAFPNLNTGENLMLNGDRRQFVAFNPAINSHALVSNVFNDIQRSDLEWLHEHWVLEKQLQRGAVWMALYRKP